MGSLTTGRLAFRKYRIDEKLPSNFVLDKMREIRAHRFRDIPQESDKESSMGWVSIRNLLDTELDPDMIMDRDHMLLSLRVDMRKIPTRLFNAHLEKATEKYMMDKGKNKISKDEKQTIKYKLKMRLLKYVLPTPYVYDLAWNLKTNQVYFFSTGKTINDDFCALFYSTFKLRLRTVDCVSLFRVGMESSVKKSDRRAPAEQRSAEASL